MILYGIYLNIIILLILNHNTRGWYVNFESYKHEYNPDFAKLDLHFVNSSLQRKVVNGSIIFNQELERFDVIFFISSPNTNGKHWTLLNITINGCDFIEKSRSKTMNFPYIILDELRASNPNFPKKCPVKKDTVILLKEFYINSEKISLSFPELSFNFSFTLRYRRLEAFKIFVNGSVKNK